jgi:hypothetical protein
VSWQAHTNGDKKEEKHVRFLIAINERKEHILRRLCVNHLGIEPEGDVFLTYTFFATGE